MDIEDNFKCCCNHEVDKNNLDKHLRDCNLYK